MHPIKPSKTTLTLHNFDIFQIADSGQCFRLSPLTDRQGCSLISQGRYAQLLQAEASMEPRKATTVTLLCSPGDEAFWHSYLDLNTDYSHFIETIQPEDTYLTAAAHYGQGIRILRQEPWEMIITFIISQQKTIPKIREAIEALSQNYGSAHTNFLGETYYGFPTPAQLSQASLEDLQALKLGYRAKYIHKTCQDILNGNFDLDRLPSLSYTEAMSALMQLYGIGEKVANCICLFGLHHIDAFPVDTWIQKILLREYFLPKYKKLPKNRLYTTIIQDHFSTYHGYAGVMQQYIFYYERTR